MNTAHQTFIEAGFHHTHHAQEVLDHGNGETGPMPEVSPEYDEYTDGECRIFMINGVIKDIEMRDHQLEAWIDSMTSEPTTK